MKSWLDTARFRFRRDHRWAPGRMSDYLDGDLGPPGDTRMERHLGQCDECRRLLAALRRTIDALHRFAGPADSVDAVNLAAAVRGRIDRAG